MKRTLAIIVVGILLITIFISCNGNSLSRDKAKKLAVQESQRKLEEYAEDWTYPVEFDSNEISIYRVFEADTEFLVVTSCPVYINYGYGRNSETFMYMFCIDKLSGIIMWDQGF